jgi:hypothetical protein
VSAVVTAWDFIDPELSKIFKRRIEINTVREFLGHRSQERKFYKSLEKAYCLLVRRNKILHKCKRRIVAFSSLSKVIHQV